MTYLDLVCLELDRNLPTLRCLNTGVHVAWHPELNEQGYYKIALIESKRSKRIKYSICRDVNQLFVTYVELEHRIRAQRKDKTK